MLSIHYITLLTLFLISCSIRSLRSCSCVASRWLFRYLGTEEKMPSINQFPSFLFLRTVPLKCKCGAVSGPQVVPQVANPQKICRHSKYGTLRIWDLRTQKSASAYFLSFTKIWHIRYSNALIQSTK
jgi:hypothetical protein